MSQLTVTIIQTNLHWENKAANLQMLEEKIKGIQEKTELVVLPEPQLQFRFQQKLIAPHDGLSMFGPFDSDLPEHPASLSYAIVGTPEGLKAAADFFGVMKNQIVNDPKDLNQRLWPTFPG